MKRNRSILTAVLIFFVVITLLTKASFAWSDDTQHKTNIFTISSPIHNISLIEDFKSPLNWKKGETVTNELFVRNGADNDNVSKFRYKPMFVRIQLREFLGYEKKVTELSHSKYYQNELKEFYKFDSEQAAIDFATSLNLNSVLERVDKIKGIKDEEFKYYIRVLEDDKSEMPFNYLVQLKSVSDLISLETGDVVNKIESTDDKHNNIGLNGQNLEDTLLYKTHTWEFGKPSLTPEHDIFSPYVTWNLGNDVIAFEEWVSDYNSLPVAKWIVDTNPFGEGWVYWGQALNHSANGDDNSITSPFMRSITMKERIEGRMEYRIHTNLDAVSSDEIDSWVNAPKAIKEALKVVN